MTFSLIFDKLSWTCNIIIVAQCSDNCHMEQRIEFILEFVVCDIDVQRFKIKKFGQNWISEMAESQAAKGLLSHRPCLNVFTFWNEFNVKTRFEEETKSSQMCFVIDEV